MRQSEAFLEGSILYIDGREMGVDFTPDEAAEEVASLAGIPGAPTGVRIFSRPRRYKKRRSQVGWPKDYSGVFLYKSPTGSGWPT